MNDKKLNGRPDGIAERGPVSKPELARLRARRESLAPVLEYKLGEPTVQRMRKIDVVRARRAHYVEDRLKSIDGQAETDFALDGISGRAKHDFERSR